MKFPCLLPDTQSMEEQRQGIRVFGRLLQTRWIVTLAILSYAVSLLASHHVSTPLGRNASFLPAMLAVIASANALTAFVLFQRFLAGGRGHLIGVACAYLYSSAMVIPHAMTFAGVVTSDGIFAASRSTSVWFWVAWHVGFPIILSFALSTCVLTQRWTVTQQRRRTAVIGSISVTIAFVVAISVGIILGDAHLPTLVITGRTGRLMEVAGWWIIGANLVAAACAFAHVRTTDGSLAWLPVATVTSLADVTLALLSGARYTAGWYSGRGFSLLTANIVLGALLVEFSRLYRNSEMNRRSLEDEALDLLRENRAALYREDRVRRVIENAADAYIEIDREGAIQAWNGKATELFGWTNAAVKDRQFVETIMAEVGWAELRELVDEFWTSEDRFDGSYAELLVRSGDGREFPAEATLWVDESDFHPRMSFFLRDITIRRETQAKMEQALVEEREALLRLQEIDRVKSNFVSSISHELRSPLTNTLGYLELLSDGDVGELSANQLHMVNVAQRNATRLFTLIEDLLMLSRVEEGAFSVRFKAVAIQDVLNVVRSANMAIAEERDITLSLDVADVVGVCPGDAKQLTRALSNIVNNAVKFTNTGGRVEISAQQIPGQNEIEILVRDDGIGIPHEEQGKLFERFFRTSISVDQQYQGAGLGLTITKAIVDHHGGTVHVDSRLGKGTTVMVRLPALITVPTAVDTATIDV